jgi:hypothetical protein
MFTTVGIEELHNNLPIDKEKLDITSRISESREEEHVTRN